MEVRSRIALLSKPVIWILSEAVAEPRRLAISASILSEPEPVNLFRVRVL